MTETKFYRGWEELEVSPKFIQEITNSPAVTLERALREEGFASLDETNPNQYFILNSNSLEEPILTKLKISYNKEGELEKKISQLQPNGTYPVKARNLRQELLIDALFDRDIPLVFAVGPAGTGKTYVAIASGYKQKISEKYGDLIISRPAVGEGQDIGYLPGTQEEKLKPWLAPIFDNISATYGKGKQHSAFKPEVQDLSKIQGRSIAGKYVLVDEAQNLKEIEAKMVATRIAANTKMVFTGDPEQISTNLGGLNETHNGIVYLSDNTRSSIYTATVGLTWEDIERSEVVKDVIRLLP